MRGGILQYTWESLLLLRNPDYPALKLGDCWELIKRHENSSDQQDKVSKRRRGRRGGLRKRLASTQVCLLLLSIILDNLRSLRNKLDELQENITCHWVYKEASLICLTEIRLDDIIANSELYLDGFGTPLRLDCDTASSQKKLESLLWFFTLHHLAT